MLITKYGNKSNLLTFFLIFYSKNIQKRDRKTIRDINYAIGKSEIGFFVKGKKMGFQIHYSPKVAIFN